MPTLEAPLTSQRSMIAAKLANTGVRRPINPVDWPNYLLSQPDKPAMSDEQAFQNFRKEVERDLKFYLPDQYNLSSGLASEHHCSQTCRIAEVKSEANFFPSQSADFAICPLSLERKSVNREMSFANSTAFAT